MNLIKSLAKIKPAVYFYLTNMYKKMKSPMFNVVISVVVVSIIIISMLCSCSTVMPYSPETLFTKEYPYEGFQGLEYQTADPKQSDLVVNKYLINGQNSAHCMKVQGMDGLFCNPNAKDANIDKFSDAKGDANCFGKSSGLSNSKGSLCLGSELTNMLQTRGGNQTGRPDQY